MKYLEHENCILISLKEFVRTARRGICASLPLDEEDIGTGAPSAYTRRLLLENDPGYKIEEILNLDGYNFKLTAKIDKAESSTVTKICEGNFNPKRTPKELKEQARGEAFIFAYLYAKIHGLKSVSINTLYVNAESGEYEKKSESASIGKLTAFFEKCIFAVSIYAKPEIERVTKRLPSMRKLKFPYKTLRESQKEFIQSAHKSISHGTTLFATAPTGTGKTVSALYPAVRSIGEGKISKAFYLTPKTTTALAAEECIRLFCKQEVTILGITLTAKEKICINNSVCKNSKKLCKYCDFNNLSSAVMDLYRQKLPVVTEKEIKRAAKEHSVCPYELSLAYSELCDVIICDFNYIFDTNVYIRRYFDDGGEFVFLIDEAHNLPDRAREMYSAELSFDDIMLPIKSQIIGEHSSLRAISNDTATRFYDITYPYLKENLYKSDDGSESSFAHLKEVPKEFYDCFSELIFHCENALLIEFGSKDEEKDKRIKFIREYLFKIKAFNSAINRFSSSYELFLYLENREIRAKVFCIDPGRDIEERLKKGKSAVFFSATLAPLYYYKSVLGADNSSQILELPSPFDSSQVSVSIMDKISTRYSEREDSLLAICRTVAATVSAKRGNYLVFSPSFEYNDKLSAFFREKYPKIKVLTQTKDMSKKEKEDFLSEFSKESHSYLIGFCVMGGIYSEGIDLAGDALIGAIIIGIGMPSLSCEREAIQAYYDEKFEEGKQFAYIYPGINRVLQAAGRVIRREDDTGVIVLIDDRFADPIYKKIMPKLWSGMRFVSTQKELNERVLEFWNEQREN